MMEVRPRACPPPSLGIELHFEWGLSYLSLQCPFNARSMPSLQCLASVLGKMPSFDLSLSGELDAYGRRIWSRIVVGTIGSLIGTAFLGWGVVPITIKDQTFTDALGACGSPEALPCPITKMLIVIGVAMLLGVSERTLPSFEQRVFGSRPLHKFHLPFSRPFPTPIKRPTF